MEFFKRADKSHFYFSRRGIAYIPRVISRRFTGRVDKKHRKHYASFSHRELTLLRLIEEKHANLESIYVDLEPQRFARFVRIIREGDRVRIR